MADRFELTKTDPFPIGSRSIEIVPISGGGIEIIVSDSHPAPANAIKLTQPEVCDLVNWLVRYYEGR